MTLLGFAIGATGAYACDRNPQPFQTQVNLSQHSDTIGDVDVIDVPAGKLLELKYVSAKITAPKDRTPLLIVASSTSTDSVNLKLPGTLFMSGNQFDFYAINQPLTLYSMPKGSIVLQLVVTGTEYLSDASVTVVGELTDRCRVIGVEPLRAGSVLSTPSRDDDSFSPNHAVNLVLKTKMARSKNDHRSVRWSWESF